MEYEKPVCYQCIKEAYLQNHIKTNGTKQECDFCSKSRKCIPLENLTEMVCDVFEKLLEPGENNYNFDGDSPQFEDQDGDSLEFWVATILDDDEDSKIVTAVLEEIGDISHFEIRDGGNSLYDDCTNYVRRPIRPIFAEQSWQIFKRDIKHGIRFFNNGAKVFLEWLFKDIDEMHTYRGQKIVRILNSKDIYRARRSDTKDSFSTISKNPSSTLYAPPKDKAASGRMNSSGVSVFYGAFSRKTCVAELRPPVGSRVASGKFRIIKPIRVLDFTVLRNAFHKQSLSYFDPEFSELEERIHFLNIFNEKISIPVLPGKEDDYLTTQVIAEFLSTQLDPIFDGIIFSSAQIPKGKNIVIFSHVINSKNNVFEVFEEGNNKAANSNETVVYIQNSLVLHNIIKASYRMTDKALQDGEPEDYDYEYENWDV